jgi:hypothetical protein
VIVAGGCRGMKVEENIKAETSILTFEFDEKVYPGAT